jgi:hypothetical protein
MIVTIHQPEHFPYMGFFQKICAADLFVVLDIVNFRKNYYQNRNKIKTLVGSDEWVTVPVEKKATSKSIKDVMTSPDPRWRKKVTRKIHQNLKLDMTDVYSHDKLVDINMAGIDWALKKMGITTKVIFASEINVEGTKSELLAAICREVGASTYISGPSGKDYLDLSLFDGVRVEFFQPKVQNYYSCLCNLI